MNITIFGRGPAVGLGSHHGWDAVTSSWDYSTPWPNNDKAQSPGVKSNLWYLALGCALRWPAQGHDACGFCSLLTNFARSMQSAVSLGTIYKILGPHYKFSAFYSGIVRTNEIAVCIIRTNA